MDPISTVLIRVIDSDHTYLYDFKRMPISGEYIYIDDKEVSGVYKIRIILLTPTHIAQQDAVADAIPIQTGMEYSGINENDILSLLDNLA